MSKALTQEEIDKALQELPGWSYENSKLHKTLVLGNFREAMGFLVRVGFEAETRNHHPELSNVYSKVSIALQTHDAGNQVTQKDVDLAKAIEALA